MNDESRCTWHKGSERCILTGRETPPDDRVLCGPHRDELLDGGPMNDQTDALARITQLENSVAFLARMALLRPAGHATVRETGRLMALAEHWPRSADAAARRHLPYET